jgi:CheY-like chemotaxis protein
MNSGNATQACILLVEDEPLICECAAEALSEQGFAVKAVSNAADALRHLASGARVDALFTDINLAGEMDGGSLACRARELRPQLAVIYTSGRHRDTDRLAPVAGSMFLPKPYNLARVGRMLDSLIAAAARQERCLVSA